MSDDKKPEAVEALVDVEILLRSGRSVTYRAPLSELAASHEQWNEGTYMGRGSDPGQPFQLILVNQEECEGLIANVANVADVGCVVIPPQLVETVSPMIATLAISSGDDESTAPLRELWALIEKVVPAAAAMVERLRFDQPEPGVVDEEDVTENEQRDEGQTALVCPSCDGLDHEVRDDGLCCLDCGLTASAGSFETFET